MIKHWKFLLTFLLIFFIVGGFLFDSFSSSKALAQKMTSNQFEDEEEALAEKKIITAANLNEMISYLEEIKIVVEKFNYLTSSDKVAILEEIQTYKSFLMALKDIAANETSLDAIKTSDSEILNYWNNVYVRAFYWNGSLMQSKVDKMYQQFENIIDELDAEIKKANKQSSSAAQSLVLAREKLKILADKKAQSQYKFAEINDKSTTSVIFTQGKQYIKEAEVLCSELKKELLDTIYYIEN